MRRQPLIKNANAEPKVKWRFPMHLANKEREREGEMGHSMDESSILAQFRVNWRGINKKSPVIAGAARLSGSSSATQIQIQIQENI